jgi:polyisoprenoid-binding protein YceI
MRLTTGIVATTVGLLVYGVGMTPTVEAGQQGVTFELGEGTKAHYRVGERLVGIDFGNDAVGTTEAVTGKLVLKSDGSVDAAQSNITVDMRTFKSDQSLRDQYVGAFVLQTQEFPMLEFVPSRAVGLPHPLPVGSPFEGNPAITIPSAVGFELIGNVTMHGVTQEVTWTVVATLLPDAASGRATASVTFDTFGITKPSVASVATVEDTINLEIEFQATRSGI